MTVRRVLAALATPAAAALLLSIGGSAASGRAPGGGEPSATGAARLLFGGDVMLGRGVAPALAAAPAALFGDVRDVLDASDFVAANLESPLTRRPHDPATGPNALEAPPSAALALAAAGFDAMSIANNHAGDAGPATPADTARALRAAGLLPLGATSGGAPSGLRVVTVSGLRVALLAFDATGLAPGGVARWNAAAARLAVAEARARADIVAVALHGGVEYVPVSDPYLLRLASSLARWGADVVWAHGPHVVQPVRVLDPDGDGRPTVVATSLGNLLFDQHLPGTRRGALLELLVRRDGVHAYRVARTGHDDGRVQFLGWSAPRRPAVALDGEWWTAVAVPTLPPVRRVAVRGFRGDIADAAVGDPDGDGRTDLAVAFRRPYAPTPVNALLPRRLLVDNFGRSAHLGLYDPVGLRPRWVAGTLLLPVAALAPCDGSLAVSYGTLAAGTPVAAGAWTWGGFGFLTLPDLPGPGLPACADIDGDGRSDPLILERSSRR